jgi:hypothetical protein
MRSLRRTLFAVWPGLVMLALAGCKSDIYDVRIDRPVFLETTRKETVLVDVRNSSSLPFPLQEKIEAGLTAKGYKLVPIDQPEKADMQLRVLVQYVGLETPDFKGDSTLGGGLIGAGAGGLGAAAGKSGGSGVALGILAGAAVGAASGAIWEKQTTKEIFTGVVVMKVVAKGKTETANIHSRVREKGLTYEKAIDRVADSISKEIIGLF